MQRFLMLGLALGLMACQGGDKDDGDVTTPDTPDTPGDADTDTDTDSDTDTDTDTDSDTDTDTDADTDTDSDTDVVDTSTLPTGLNGAPPATPIPLLSSFVVVNRLGENKGPTDLVGTPTVMWFYPAAATGG